MESGKFILHKVYRMHRYGLPYIYSRAGGLRKKCVMGKSKESEELF
jgi:hypothetical protein